MDTQYAARLWVLHSYAVHRVELSVRLQQAQEGPQNTAMKAYL